jgi:hypothetical protein
MESSVDDAALYDLCQSLFGLGSWDEGSGVPWWKARNLEISKIKASRTKRGTSVETLWSTALWCADHHVKIQYVTDLYGHVSAALKWAREQALAAQVADARRDLDEAIAYEQAFTDQTWLEQLLRVQGADNIREVVGEWKAARNR